MNESEKIIRIIVADDHAVVRNGICRILDSEEDMEVVGEAGDGQEAVEKCVQLKPNVIVLDYDMPGIDGLTATHQISELGLGIRILTLTMYDREDFAMRFLKAGASGFLPKNITFEELPFAVRKVAAGSVYMTASNAAKPEDWKEDDVTGDLSSLLSEREFQVLIRLAKGKKTGEIAQDLDISYNTVKTYKYRIMEKLNLKNAYDLARFAIRKNLSEIF